MTDQTAEAFSDADLKRLHGLAYNAVGSVDVSVIQPALRALLADRERLRGALEPFADEFGAGIPRHDDFKLYGNLTIGHFRAARAALNTQGEGEP